ncbi:MAG: hypothetical protein H7A44_11190 [Opitutaceae bacterium]|nr:hypothetical protein [Cephaloticoccus sp.]MCP5530992.1 hypothetical protein [Opitutaceae bacterium]
MKASYQLRGKRRQRLRKPEYTMTGILVGIIVGWIVGFGIELCFKPNMLIMVGTGVAGFIFGAGFEAIRLWWRMRCFCAGNKIKPRPFL